MVAMEIAKLMLKFIFYFILNFKYLNPLLLILLKSNPFTNEREREREKKRACFPNIFKISEAKVRGTDALCKRCFNTILHFYHFCVEMVVLLSFLIKRQLMTKLSFFLLYVRF